MDHTQFSVCLRFGWSLFFQLKHLSKFAWIFFQLFICSFYKLLHVLSASFTDTVAATKCVHSHTDAKWLKTTSVLVSAAVHTQHNTHKLREKMIPATVSQLVIRILTNTLLSLRHNSRCQESEAIFCDSRCVFIILQVTTKGAGLNPNAKVWQEVPAHQSDTSEGTEDSSWLQTYPPAAEMTNGIRTFILFSLLSWFCQFVNNKPLATHTETEDIS